MGDDCESAGPAGRRERSSRNQTAALRFCLRHLCSQRYRARRASRRRRTRLYAAPCGFETDINFAEQEVLNPLGVNCLRFFTGRGYRVWGARTASSDPEWKYVNVRRYFIYLEASIDRGTQWAVFEPNGETTLGQRSGHDVASFLYNEWKSGALLGTTQQEAFFVRCDRSTMTQNDLDNGRLICLSRRGGDQAC